jgi:hypothetical protein
VRLRDFGAAALRDGFFFATLARELFFLPRDLAADFTGRRFGLGLAAVLTTF